MFRIKKNIDWYFKAVIFFTCMLFSLLSLEADCQDVLKDAMEEMLAAEPGKETEKMIRQVLKYDQEFNDLFQILQNGVGYSKDETGFFSITNHIAGQEVYNLVFVPYNYNPIKETEVRIHLHGGVINVDPHFIDQVVDRDDPEYLTRNFISVYPSGWVMAQWWSKIQLKNIDLVLREIKLRYNIDENRISMQGFSDGATGTYYFANVRPGYFAAYFSMLGNPEGLNQLSDQPQFAFNLVDKSFLIIATKEDQMFPYDQVSPYFSYFMGIGKDISFLSIEDYGHDLNWMPLVADTIESFYSNNLRNPYPDTLFFCH